MFGLSDDIVVFDCSEVEQRLLVDCFLGGRSQLVLGHGEVLDVRSVELGLGPAAVRWNTADPSLGSLVIADVILLIH
jgi:hypothetical protein